MKRAQILVLLVAVIAAIGAIFLVRPRGEAVSTQQIVVMPSQEMGMTEILVAAADIPLWQTLSQHDLHWQAWPTESIPDGVIRRIDEDQVYSDLTSMMTRTPFARGEPLRFDRLMDASGETGFLSAALPAGMRAVAISIDAQGTSSAGGFIHPNDRVDVIRLFREEEQSDQGSGPFSAETLMTNVRVLAIGPNVQTDPRGQTTVHGETATVEVTPAQAQILALAQRTGHLVLTLRSFADLRETVQAEEASRPVTVLGGGTAGFSTSRYVVAREEAVNEAVGQRARQAPRLRTPAEIASARLFDNRPMR